MTACYEEIEQVPTFELQLSDRILHPLTRAEFPTVKLKITATLGRRTWKESPLAVLCHLFTNQKFRDGAPHETKAYAIAKPAKTTLKLTVKQPLKKTVPNLRSQEVSREMASKSADMTFVG